MSNCVRALLGAAGCFCLLIGCGTGSDTKIVRATGIVTYKGAPLAGATVTFLPQNGPLAIGLTDLKGEFKLNTGALPGCAIGPAEATVKVMTADDEGESSPAASTTNASGPAAADEIAKKMATMTLDQQKKKSASKAGALIPPKYNDTKTSGLKYTIDADSSKNKFVIDLN